MKLERDREEREGEVPHEHPQQRRAEVVVREEPHEVVVTDDRDEPWHKARPVGTDPGALLRHVWHAVGKVDDGVEVGVVPVTLL